jgi:hypothetical protein
MYAPNLLCENERAAMHRSRCRQTQTEHLAASYSIVGACFRKDCPQALVL